MKLRKAVFLDRDGTINEESDYLYRIEDCRFIPGAIEAIQKLNHAGFLVVVVTNQSGIARGYYTEDDLARLHLFMDGQIKAGGGKVDAWYYCPHHPDHSYGTGECDCRKPLPGMLRTAADELGIDLLSSWIIGDKVADVEAGAAVDCQQVLVRTGHGSKEALLVSSSLPVFDDLYSAVEHITNPDLKG